MNDDERICARLRGLRDDDVNVCGLRDVTRATSTRRYARGLRRVTYGLCATFHAYVPIDDVAHARDVANVARVLNDDIRAMCGLTTT